MFALSIGLLFYELKIPLLVVVAIIAVLAASLIGNFSQRQVVSSIIVTTRDPYVSSSESRTERFSLKDSESETTRLPNKNSRKSSNSSQKRVERHRKIVELRKTNSLGKIALILSMPKSSVQTELNRHENGKCTCASE